MIIRISFNNSLLKRFIFNTINFTSFDSKCITQFWNCTIKFLNSNFEGFTPINLTHSYLGNINMFATLIDYVCCYWRVHFRLWKGFELRTDNLFEIP